jgi:hypothetical protein
MNRREFIKYGGAGLLLFGGSVMFDFSGLVELHSSGRCVRSRISENIETLTSEENEILRLATLAPSGHNTQPWTIKIVEPRHWMIGSEQARWLPAVDPDNREMILSIGAFLENMAVAAKHFGYDLEIKIIASSTIDTEIADVRLTRCEPRLSAIENIQLRRTIRNHLSPREIASSDIRDLIGEVHHSCFFPLHSFEGQYLKEGTIEANSTQAFRDSAQLELTKWIRWSDAEADANLNGLTPDSMEIQGITRWYVKHFYNRKKVLEKSFRDHTLEIVQEQVKSCGGWLVITSRNSSIKELIDTGRLLQRIWLKASKKMIAIHPMTQMLEEYPWKNSITAQLGVEDEVQFILRVGYVSEYLQPISLRMPLSRLLI